jgi:hypothetical protein
MILNNKTVFQECLIKRKGSKDLEKNNTPQQKIIDDKPIIIDNSLEDSTDENTPTPVCESIIEELLDDDVVVENIILDNNSNEENNITTEKTKEKTDVTKDLEDNREKNTNDLEDISDNFLVKTTNEIKLKKPNEVYWEIYKIAKQKAKQHKKAAISAYLEAKNIKKTYLLEDMDNSDSSDNEDNDSDSDIIKQEINNMVEEL